MRKIISLITLFSFSIQAATITDDKLTVGKKASASAKEIVFDTNDGTANKKLSVDKITKKLSATSDEVIVGDGTATDKALTFNRGGSNASIKWDEATAKLKFANDGASFKDLGSGSGGGSSTGVNVLTNASFEDAVGGVISDWTNTGGTLTQQTYTNGVEGDLKYFQFVATGAGEYFEMVKTVPTNFSAGCQVDFKKLNIATDDLFKVEALDGSNNVLASGNVKVSSWVKFPTLSFACPSAGSTFKIRVTSLAAGTLQGDTAYLGSNQNIVNIAQAKLLGTVTITGCADFWNTASTTFVDYPAQTGCVYTVSGSAKAPSTMIPAIKFDTLGAGEYVIEYEGMSTQGTSSGYLSSLQFWDGTTTARGWSSFGGGTSSIFMPSISQSFTYTSAKTNVTLSLRAKTENAASSTRLYGTNLWPAVIKVYYFPAQSEQAVNTDQASWFIDANIGGGAISLGTAAVTSYTVPTESALDLVINSAKGSASAEIACASGTASTGLNCGAAAETPGISFFPPYSGFFEACFSVAHQVDINPSSQINTTFQLIETSNTSTAILSEGSQRVTSGISSGATTTVIPYLPNTVCGTFNFTDTSKKTIRMAYEQAVSGSVTFSRLLADRSANDGQRDIHVTVRPILSAYNRPILTGDQVTAPSTTKLKMFTFKTSSVGTVTQDIGDIVNGNAVVTDTSIFTYVLNPKFSTWNSCYVKTNEIEGANGIYEKIQTQTLNSLIIRTGYLTSTLVKAPYNHEVTCFGE